MVGAADLASAVDGGGVSAGPGGAVAAAAGRRRVGGGRGSMSSWSPGRVAWAGWGLTAGAAAQGLWLSGATGTCGCATYLPGQVSRNALGRYESGHVGSERGTHCVLH